MPVKKSTKLATPAVSNKSKKMSDSEIIDLFDNGLKSEIRFTQLPVIYQDMMEQLVANLRD